MKCPASHRAVGSQVGKAVGAGVGLEVGIGFWTQAVAAVDHLVHWPTGQSWQAWDANSVTFIISQNPPWAWYLPEAQWSQFVAAVLPWNLPFAHDLHAPATFPLWYWPMGQSEQRIDRSAANFPAIQFRKWLQETLTAQSFPPGNLEKGAKEI